MKYGIKVLARKMCNGCNGVSLGNHGVSEGDRIPSLKNRRVNCLDLEIRHNIVFLLHALKALRGLLFYMLCAVFQRMFLNIFVMILFTFSAICVFVFIFKF